jgi:hypothetical protein
LIWKEENFFEEMLEKVLFAFGCFFGREENASFLRPLSSFLLVEGKKKRIIYIISSFFTDAVYSEVPLRSQPGMRVSSMSSDSFALFCPFLTNFVLPSTQDFFPISPFKNKSGKILKRMRL